VLTLQVIDAFMVYALLTAAVQVSATECRRRTNIFGHHAFHIVTMNGNCDSCLQFLYMLCVGTFPFNSFLSGFFCSVGFFVLSGDRSTALLRLA
jgi:hypothetical protein